MKRIVDGKTYNTETATCIAAAPEDFNNPERHDALYQTRFGAFFRHFGGETNEGDYYEQLKPVEPSEAQTWLERNEFTDEVERLFGLQPEAGEAESRVTVRMPDNLKVRIEMLAKANNQSMNAWIMRCIETCATAQSQQR